VFIICITFLIGYIELEEGENIHKHVKLLHNDENLAVLNEDDYIEHYKKLGLLSQSQSLSKILSGSGSAGGSSQQQQQQQQHASFKAEEDDDDDYDEDDDGDDENQQSKSNFENYCKHLFKFDRAFVVKIIKFIQIQDF